MGEEPPSVICGGGFFALIHIGGTGQVADAVSITIAKAFAVDLVHYSVMHHFFSIIGAPLV